jgi:hypothetical protein
MDVDKNTIECCVHQIVWRTTNSPSIQTTTTIFTHPPVFGHAPGCHRALIPRVHQSHPIHIQRATFCRDPHCAHNIGRQIHRHQALVVTPPACNHRDSVDSHRCRGGDRNNRRHADSRPRPHPDCVSPVVTRSVHGAAADVDTHWAWLYCKRQGFAFSSLERHEGRRATEIHGVCCPGCQLCTRRHCLQNKTAAQG